MPLCYTQSTPLVNRCLYFSENCMVFREAKKVTKVLKMPWIKCKSTLCEDKMIRETGMIGQIILKYEHLKVHKITYNFRNSLI